MNHKKKDIIYDEAMIKLNHGMEFGMTYEQRDDILEALERAKKVAELLGLYRKHYRNDVVYDHNGKLIHQIMKLEEELK